MKRRRAEREEEKEGHYLIISFHCLHEPRDWPHLPDHELLQDYGEEWGDVSLPAQISGPLTSPHLTSKEERERKRRQERRKCNTICPCKQVYRSVY